MRVIFVQMLLGISVAKRRVQLTITNIRKFSPKISHIRLVAILFEDRFCQRSFGILHYTNRIKSFLSKYITAITLLVKVRMQLKIDHIQMRTTQ